MSELEQQIIHEEDTSLEENLKMDPQRASVKGTKTGLKRKEKIAAKTEASYSKELQKKR